MESAMVATHLNTLRSLLDRVALDRSVTVECRHFFSGAAAYANGRIFMTLTSVGLALKLSSESRADLLGLGARPLRYFSHGPIKKDYVVVPQSVAGDIDAVTPWIARSVLFALSLSKARPARGPRRRG
jgi:TfoX/Sxy family transcriptional regulator of competence genes